MSTRTKNKEHTKQRILTAISELLCSEGYAALGVNRIAKQADVDKVLIYRYFDGLEGALKAYGETEDFWPSSDEIVGMPVPEFNQLDYLTQRKTLTRNTLRAMRKRPQTLAILAWEMVETNELTRVLAKVREQQNIDLHNLLKSPGHAKPVMDEAVIDIVLAAAVHYLAVSNLSDRPIFGRSTNINWARIEKSLDFMHDGIDLAEKAGQDN